MAHGLVVVVQARTGSRRLPGKVLAEVAGRPMLGLQLERLKPLGPDHLVVATSDLPADDVLVSLAERSGAEVIRGSETDVLARFGAVIEQFEPATVVRLTGDCPLTDPGIVDDVVELHLRSGADYTSNVHPRSFARGLDVEVASAAALSTAVAQALDPYEREHVTPFLYRHPERFTSANLDSGHDLAHLRWTVDSPEDIEHVRQIVDVLDNPVIAPWTEILSAVRRAGLVS